MLRKLALSTLFLLLMASVSMAATLYKVKYAASPTTGGLVTAPDSRNPYPTSNTVGARFRAQANFGKKILAVSLTNGVSDGIITYAPDYSTSGYFTVIPNKDTTVTVTFGVAPSAVYANAGPSLNLTGLGSTKTVLLTGSASSVPVIPGLTFTYQWSISDPNGHFVTPNSNTTLFYADVPGYYYPTLVVKAVDKTSAPAQTSVNVFTNTNADSAYCIGCHLGRSQQVVTEYKASLHNSSPVGPSCQSCHTEVSPGAAHPLNLIPLSTIGNICKNCHVDSQGNVPRHPFPIGTNTCVPCHNPHSTVGNIAGASAAHFNTQTSAGYPASYVTSRATCIDCHFDGSQNLTVRGQWARTGHANTRSPAWMYYDYKTLSGCVQCHTTTGFIAYSTGKITKAWGVASDKTKELLTCPGCHTDISNGTVATVTPNKPFADEAGYTNHNMGTSNICMPCHSGWNNGMSIQVKVGSADFSNMSYIAPHYMTAAGTIQGKSAYLFPGRTYANYSNSSHSKIGMTDNNGTGTNGPCVACHMSAPNKHAFKVVSSSSGEIKDITATVCTKCHTALPAATLNTQRVAFENALEILRIVLQEKVYPYSPNEPYFVATNWGSGQAGANVMGAAFNYKLFLAEAGAYTHYPLYAKQLIVDSIDAVFNNGTVTGDITSALNDLLGKGLITNDQISSLTAYKNPESSCTSCHGNPPATDTHLGVSTGTCALCHVYTGPGGVTHNNGTVDVSHMCNTCHGNPPTSQTIHTTGAVKYNHDNSGTIYNDCTVCHTSAAAVTHRDGTVEVLTNTTACSSCHSYPPNSSIHATATPANCTVCHIYDNYNAATHNDSKIDTTCVACHGNPPTSQTIHTNGAVKYNHDKSGTIYTDCTVCHTSAAAGTDGGRAGEE